MKNFLMLVIMAMMVFMPVTIPVDSSAMDQSANFKFHRLYENAQDDIWFNHKGHVIREGRDCSKCHTDRIDPNGGYIGTNVRGQDGVYRNTGHEVCANCHDFENTNNGASAPENCSGGMGGGSCHGWPEPE